ncbi:ABC transporter permease [Rickettsiella endosymbiont of Miltochrista miniata]|uniref:ABC transporter permease n=1 Tax=Rickettsiella endosymbiont of Miltochrista miniata TaxID=3066239 RepID=UPI00313D6299
MAKSALYEKYDLAWDDITEGLKSWRIWLLLAWHEVKLRYRRSTLGPFWITISMAITIYSMGVLYGHLFKMDLAVYYPFLATGILGWNLISLIVNDATMTFVNADQFIKQMKQPYSVFMMQSVARNFIIFFHNILVLVPLILFFHLKINVNTLFIFVSLLILWINAITYSTILALWGTRFRDIPILVASLIQVVFFLTPIMWSPSILPERYHFIIDYNPFAQFMELFRNPLLGKLPSNYTLMTTFGLTMLGIFFAFIIFSRYRARIAYWL